MREISTGDYGPLARDLIAKAAAEQRPKTLVFAAPDSTAEAMLRAMSDQTISKNRRVRMPHDAQALHAALWLLFDFMKESHDISQAIATPSGSYWHGILHRREPDAFNAKYWMARVGEHPIFPELLSDAKELAAATPSGASISAKLGAMTKWDAAWFADQCCTAPAAVLTETLLQIQRREWALLFDYNFKKAFA
ncbi:MAG TPA: hypothetical protein VKX17_10260 [Planctomycetota bacterium]|nr:hypothetical protein [Planctomycetota bacterium]